MPKLYHNIITNGYSNLKKYASVLARVQCDIVLEVVQVVFYNN